VKGKQTLENTGNKVPMGIEDKNPLRGDLLVTETHRADADAATYLRDVYDHMLVILEMVQSCHDFISTLTETYMSTVSNRLNEIMKTLTVITTIFVPLTFLTGVYGMNMSIPTSGGVIPYSGLSA
jgi:Mg2+ and Co2+ transporter CorA